MFSRRLLTSLMLAKFMSRTCDGFFLTGDCQGKSATQERSCQPRKRDRAIQAKTPFASPPSFEERSRHIELPAAKIYHVSIKFSSTKSSPIIETAAIGAIMLRNLFREFLSRILAKEIEMENKRQGSLAGFLVPSIVGIILFMIPVQYDGSWTIVVKIIADMISNAIGDFLPGLCVGIVTLSAILGIVFLGKPNFIATYPIVANTFSTTAIWLIRYLHYDFW